MFSLFTKNMFNLFRKTATKSVQISHKLHKKICSTCPHKIYSICSKNSNKIYSIYLKKQQQNSFKFHRNFIKKFCSTWSHIKSIQKLVQSIQKFVQYVQIVQICSYINNNDPNFIISFTQTICAYFLHNKLSKFHSFALDKLSNFFHFIHHARIFWNCLNKSSTPKTLSCSI